MTYNLGLLIVFKGLPRWLSSCLQSRSHGLDQEDPLEEGVATHSSILAWRIPWMEEPGRLQTMELQRDGTQLKWLSTRTQRLKEWISNCNIYIPLNRKTIIFQTENLMMASAEFSHPCDTTNHQWPPIIKLLVTEPISSSFGTICTSLEKNKHVRYAELTSLKNILLRSSPRGE